MISLRALFFLCFWLLPFILIAQIKGYVINSDNEPIPFVKTFINQEIDTVFTNFNGYFEFKKKHTEGIYSVNFNHYNFNDKECKVDVKRENNKPLKIEMQYDIHKLNSIKLKYTKLEKSNNERSITTISKLPVPQKYQAQSVSVINNQMLEEQQIRNLEEAVNLVPGFNMQDTRGGTQVNVQVRGYQATMLYNGLRLEPNTRGGQGLLNFNLLDNVEFVSGSSGIGLGNASPGGTVNVNSKQARINNNDFKAFSSYASWNTYTLLLDKNISLKEDKWAFRINATGTKGRRARVHTDFETYGAGFSGLYKLSNKIEIKLDYLYEYDNRVPDPGNLIWANSVVSPETLPIMSFFDDFLGFKQDFQKETKHTLTFGIDHQFTPIWKLSFKAGGYDRFRSLRTVSSVGAYETSPNPIFGGAYETFNRRVYAQEQLNKVFSSRVDLTAKDLKTFFLKHNLQFSSDLWSNFKAINGYNRPDDATIVNNPNDIFSTRDPYLTIDSVPIRSENLNFNNDIEDRNIFSDEQRKRYYFEDFNSSEQVNTNIYGFTFQDQLVYKRLRATLGFRLSVGNTYQTIYDNYNKDNEDKQQYPTDYFVGPTSNYALFYDLDKEGNKVVYASYADTFNESQTGADRINALGNSLPNAKSIQYQAGFRGSFFQKKLSIDVNAYQILDKNYATQVYDEDEEGNVIIAISDITNLGYFNIINKQSHLGVELFLQGNLTKNISLTGSFSRYKYQLADQEITGSIINPGNPDYSGNLWSFYKFKQGIFKGLSLGYGIQYVGERIVVNGYDTDTNGSTGRNAVSYLPDYLKQDARVSYVFKDIQMTLKLNNITNQLTYDAFRTSFINVISPFNFIFQLEYKL